GGWGAAARGAGPDAAPPARLPRGDPAGPRVGVDRDEPRVVVPHDRVEPGGERARDLADRGRRREPRGDRQNVAPVSWLDLFRHTPSRPVRRYLSLPRPTTRIGVAKKP